MAVLPEVHAWAQTDHFTAGRRAPILAVIIHATGGTDSLEWLRRTSNPPVSCHILISKQGTRYRIVDDFNEAWHVGFGKLSLPRVAGANNNSFTLGVELENLNDGKDPYPTPQVEALGAQLAAWEKRHGRLLWFYHSDVDTRKRDAAGLDITQVHRSYLRYRTGL